MSPSAAEPLPADSLPAAPPAKPEPAVLVSRRPAPRRRWSKAVVQLLRRGHLYAGLLLLPLVLLYGVTAFLFNHPTAFSDQPSASFGRGELAGTPMESPLTPADLAGQVVAGLQARAKPDTRYTLVELDKARFTRDFAFATVKAEGQEVSVLMDVNGNGGTVRVRSAPQPRSETVAPFAVAGREAGGRGAPGRGGPGGAGGGRRGPNGGERGRPGGGDGLKLDNPLHERVQSAVPAVLSKMGFPTGEVVVTSVPDLSFLMDADGALWRVTYNAQTGGVTGRPADEPAAEPLSARRFLTRLHTAHGYPGGWDARWAWAVLVDAMAAVMVFWGLSGIFMWWQIKATRWAGLLILLLSVAAAAWVGVEMHESLTAAAAGRGNP